MFQAKNLELVPDDGRTVKDRDSYIDTLYDVGTGQEYLGPKITLLRIPTLLPSVHPSQGVCRKKGHTRKSIREKTCFVLVYSDFW